MTFRRCVVLGWQLAMRGSDRRVRAGLVSRSYTLGLYFTDQLFGHTGLGPSFALLVSGSCFNLRFLYHWICELLPRRMVPGVL